jgi:hypothetical protein
MEHDRLDFAEFYAAARGDCLRIVLVTVGDQQPPAEQPSVLEMHLYRCGPISGHVLIVGMRSGRPEPGVVGLASEGRTLTVPGSAEVPFMCASPAPKAGR